jgi:hypothetical protein
MSLATPVNLSNRDGDVPAALRARILAAIALAEGQTAPTLEAALNCLRQSFAAEPRRAGAPDLLAADALLTWACEDAATQGTDELAAQAALMYARLAQLLDESGG